MTYKGLRTLTVATVLFLTITLLSCSQSDRYGAASEEKQSELIVAMDIDMPGYFTIGDENFGYQYDLLRAFADGTGREMTVITGFTPSDCSNLLTTGQAHIVAALSQNIVGEHQLTPIYTTHYTLVTVKRKGMVIADDISDLKQLLDGKSLLISEGFKSTKSYDYLLDSLPTTETFISSRNCLELMEYLREGEYDFLICEKSEAQLGAALVKGVAPVFEFPDELSVSIALSMSESELSHEFRSWLSTYTAGAEYAMLNDLYFQKGIVGQLIARDGTRKIPNGISQYDRIIREICEREGYDWRFISAIAYHESRFDPYIVSNRGATGLMQIMPATARQFNVPVEEISKPEVNVMLATKLLGKIESMLRFGPNATEKDKLSIVLACYNCGIGHVMDARRLARKYGSDPDRWQDVSLYLQLKSQEEYHNDEVVKCGGFRGSKETLAFVRNVIGKYDSYCTSVLR